MLLKQSFNGKNILVLGYGKSGQSAVKLLQNKANQIFVYDKNFKIEILKNNKKINNLIKNNYFLNKNNIFLNKLIIQDNKFLFEKNNIFFENNLKKILENKIHFCVLSPGISIYSKEVKTIKKLGIKILSELELGLIFSKGKVFAITGTNGKTTTCHALHHIFKTAKKESFLCGNIGTPICEIALNTTHKSFIVLEVSSFQMEATKNFSPYASALLNICPDHLDRHKSFSAYLYNKSKIFMYPKTKKFLNFDAPHTKKLSQKYLNAKTLSLKNANLLSLAQNNNLNGKHNLSNLIVASALAKSVDIKDFVIKKANKTFAPLPHRLKTVAQFKNITFINDSKSTNIASTLSALEGFSGKIVLLIGGSSKNLDFSPIAQQNIYAVVGYGETLPDIQKVFKDKSNFHCASNLKQAFQTATQIAINTDDKVSMLFSPACASFDEFTGYEKRGEFFENLVRDFIESHK